jgi:hypothetical protein
MENKKITIWDFLGACVLGAIIGGLFAVAILGGF